MSLWIINDKVIKNKSKEMVNFQEEGVNRIDS